MKRIVAILVLMALLFVGCGRSDVDQKDADKKPTSCAISDDAEE